MKSAVIRFAAPEDAGDLLAIYAPYVEHTAISFETVVPSGEEFAGRIRTIGDRYPYLVCEIGEEIAAYAYAHAYRERAAYRFGVELSVYIAERFHRRRIGTALYTCLFAMLGELGYFGVYAGITLPNEKSVGLHESLGFIPVGTYHRTGYKLGKWLDVMWLEKALGGHPEHPAEPRAVRALDGGFVRREFERCAAMIRCESANTLSSPYSASPPCSVSPPKAGKQKKMPKAGK